MSEIGRYSDSESVRSRNARSFRNRSMQEKLSQPVKQRRRRSASFHNVYIASSTDSYSNHEKFDRKRKATPYNVGDVSNLKKAWKITSSTSNLQAKALRSLQKEKEILNSFGSLSLTCYHNRSSGKEKATRNGRSKPLENDILRSSVKPVLHSNLMSSNQVQFSEQLSSSLPESCPMTRPSDCPIICLAKPKSSRPKYYQIEEEEASTLNASFPEYGEKMPKGCTRKRREDCDDRCKAKARASKIKQNIASKFENSPYADYFNQTVPIGCKKKRRSDCDQRCKDKFTPSLITNTKANTLNQEKFSKESVPEGCPMESRSKCVDRCRNKLRKSVFPFRDKITRDHASTVDRGFSKGQVPPGCAKKDISECDDRCQTRFKTLYRDPAYDEIAKYQAGTLEHAYHSDSDLPEGCPMRSRSECSDKCTGRQNKNKKMMEPALQSIQPKMAKTLASENVPPGNQKMPLGCPFTRREDCDEECQEGDGFKLDETITQQKNEALQQAQPNSEYGQNWPLNCPLKQRRECPERSNPPINMSSSLRILEEKVNDHIIEPHEARPMRLAFKEGPTVKATSVSGLGKFAGNFRREKYRVSFPPGLIKSDLMLAKLRKKKDFHGVAARRASDSAVNAVRRQKKRENAKRVALPSLKHSRGSHHGGYGHMLGPGEISSGDGEIQTCGLPKCVQEARARARKRFSKGDKPGDRENATPDVHQLLTKRPSDNIITRISNQKRADRRAGRPNVRRHPWPHSCYSEHRSCGRSGVLKYKDGLENQIKLSLSFVERLRSLRGIHSDDDNDEDYMTTVGSPIPVGKPVVLIGRLSKPDGTHTKVVILGTVRIRVKERNMYDSGDSVATLPSVHLPPTINIKAEGYAIENIKKPEIVSGDAEAVIAETQVAAEEARATTYEKVGYFDTVKKAADNFFSIFTKKDSTTHPYVCSKAVALYDTTYQPLNEGRVADSNIPVVIGRGRQVKQRTKKEEKMSKSGLKFLSNIPNVKEDEFCASNKLTNKMRVFRHEIRDVTGDQIHHMKAFPGGQETYNKDKLTHKMEFFRKNIREGEDGRLRKWRGGEDGWSPKKGKSPIPSRDLSLTEVVDLKTMKPQPDTVKINLKSLRRSSRPDLRTPKNAYAEDYGDYNAHDGALWRRGNGESSYSNSSFYKRLSRVAENLNELKKRNRGDEDIFGTVGGSSERFTCYHVYDDIENAIERNEAGEQMLYDDQGSEEDYGDVTTVEETYESVEFSEDDTGQPDEDELESFGEESTESNESEERTGEESSSNSSPTGTASSFPAPSSGIKKSSKQPKKQCRFYGFSQSAKKVHKLIIGKINKNKSKTEKHLVPSPSAGCEIADGDYHNKKFYKRIYCAMNKFTDRMFQMLPFDYRTEKSTSSYGDNSSSMNSSNREATNRSFFRTKDKRNVKRNISFYWSKSPITNFSLPLYEHKAVKKEMQHVRRTLLHVAEQAHADNKKKTLKVYRYSRSVSIPEACQPLRIVQQQKPTLPCFATEKGRSKVVIGRGRQTENEESQKVTTLMKTKQKAPTLVPQVRCGPKRDASTINYYSGDTSSSVDDLSGYESALSETSEFELSERNEGSYSQTGGAKTATTIEETATSDDSVTQSDDYENAYSETPFETSEATGLTTENLDEDEEDVEEEEDEEEGNLSTSKGYTSYGSILIKSDGQQSRPSTNPSKFSSSKRSTVTPNKYSENNYYTRTPVASTLRSSRRSPEASSIPTEMGSSRYQNASPSGTSTGFTNATTSNVPGLSSSRVSFDSQLSEDIIKTEQFQKKTIDRHKDSTKVYIGIRKFKRKTITHVPRRSKFPHKGMEINPNRAMRHDDAMRPNDVMPPHEIKRNYDVKRNHAAKRNHHDVMRRYDVMRDQDLIQHHDVIPQQVAPVLYSEPEHLPEKSTIKEVNKKSSVTKITKFLDEKNNEVSDVGGKGTGNEDKGFIDGQNICKRHVNTKLCKRITKSLGTSQSVFTASHSDDSAHMDMYGDKTDSRKRFPKGLLKMGAMDYSSTNVSVITSWWEEGSDGAKRRTGSLEEGMPPRLDSDEDEIRGRNYLAASSEDTEMPSKSYRGYAAMVYLRGDGLLMKNFRGKKPRKCRSKKELKRNYRYGNHLPPIKPIHCLKTFGRLQITSKVKNLDGDSLHLLCEEPQCLYARCLESNDFIDHPDGIKCTKWPCQQNDMEPGVSLDDVEFLLERGSKRGSSILDSDSDDPICKFAMKCKRCPIRRKFKPFFPGLYDKFAILPMAKKIVDCAILTGQELHGKVYPLYTEEDVETFCDELAEEHLETGVALYLSKTSIQCSWLDLQSESTFDDLFKEELGSAVDSSIADELTKRSIDQARRQIIIDAFIKENSPKDSQRQHLSPKHNQVDKCCFSNSNLVSFSTTVPDKDNLPEECFFNQVGNRQVFSRDVGDEKQRLIASFLPTKILAEQIIGKATKGGTSEYMHNSSIYETASSSSFPRIRDIFSETSANIKRKYSYTPISPSHPSYYKTREAVKDLLNDLIGAVVIGENLSLNANASKPGAELAYNLSQLVSEQALQNKKKKEKKRSDKIEKLAEKRAKEEADKKKQKRPNPPVSKRDNDSGSTENSVDTPVTSSQISSELGSQEDLFQGSSETTSETDEYDSEFTPTPSSRGQKIIRIQNWSKSSGLLKKAKRIVANSGPPGKPSHDFNNNFPKTLKIRRNKIPKSIKKFFKLMSDDNESIDATPSSSVQQKKAVTFSDTHLERWKRASSCSSGADCSQHLKRAGTESKSNRSRRQNIENLTCSSEIDCSSVQTSSSRTSSNGFFTASSDSNQYSNSKKSPLPSAGVFNPYEKIRLSKIYSKNINKDPADKVFGNVPKSMVKKFGNIAKHLAPISHNQKKRTQSYDVKNDQKFSTVPFPSSRATCSSKADTSEDDSDYVIFEFVPPQQLISESNVSGTITNTSYNDLDTIGFSSDCRNKPDREFEFSHTSSDYPEHTMSSSFFTHKGTESSTSSSNQCTDSLQPSGKPRSTDDSCDFHSYETILDALPISSYQNGQTFPERKELTSSEGYFTSSQGVGLKALKAEWNKLNQTKRELSDDTECTSEESSCSMDLHAGTSFGLQRKERSFKTSGPSCILEKVTIGNRVERGLCPSSNSLLASANDDSSSHLLNKFQTLTNPIPREIEGKRFVLPSRESDKSKSSGVLASSLEMDGVAKMACSKKCPSQKSPATNSEPMRIMTPRDSVVSVRTTDTFGKICDPSRPPLRIIWELSETKLNPYPDTCKPAVGLLNTASKQHCKTDIKLIKRNSNLPIVSKTKELPSTLMPTAAPQCEIKDLISELNNEMEGVCDIFNSSLVNCTDRPSEIVEHGQFQAQPNAQLTSAGDIAKMLGDLQSTVLSFFENFKNSASDIFGGSKEIEPPLRKVTRKRMSAKRYSSRIKITDDSDSSTYDTLGRKFKSLSIGRKKANDCGHDMRMCLGKRSRQKRTPDNTLAVKNYDGTMETSSKISTEAQIRQTGYLIEKTNSRMGNVRLRRYHQTITATIESSLEEETTSYNSSSEIEDINLSDTNDDLSYDWHNHEQPHPSSRPPQKKKILHPSCHCVESAAKCDNFNGTQTQHPLFKVSKVPSEVLGENDILKEKESSFNGEGKECLKNKIKNHINLSENDETFSAVAESTGTSAFHEEICNHICKHFPRIAHSNLQNELLTAPRGVLDSDGLNEKTVKSVTFGTRCFHAQRQNVISNMETQVVDLQTPAEVNPSPNVHVEKTLGKFQQFTPSTSTVQKQKKELKPIQFNNSYEEIKKCKPRVNLCNFIDTKANQSNKPTKPKVKALTHFFEDLQPGISSPGFESSSVVSSAASNSFVESNNQSTKAPPLPPKTLTPSAGSSIVRVEPLESFALSKSTEKSEYSVTDSDQDMFVRSVKVSRRKTTFGSVAYHPAESDQINSDNEKSGGNCSKSVKLSRGNPYVSTVTFVPETGKAVPNCRTSSSSSSLKSVKSTGSPPSDSANVLIGQTKRRADALLSRKNVKITQSPPSHENINIGHGRNISMTFNLDSSHGTRSEMSLSSSSTHNESNQVTTKYDRNKARVKYSQNTQMKSIVACNAMNDKHSATYVGKNNNSEDSPLHLAQYCQTSDMYDDFSEHSSSYNMYPSAGKTKILRNRGNVTPQAQSAVQINKQIPLHNEPEVNMLQDPRQTAVSRDTKKSVALDVRKQTVDERNFSSDVSLQDKTQTSGYKQLHPWSTPEAKPDTSQVINPYARRPSIDIGTRSTRLTKPEKENYKSSKLQDSVQLGRRALQRTYGPEALQEPQTRLTSSRDDTHGSSNHHKRFQDIEGNTTRLDDKHYSSSDYLNGLPCNLTTASCEQVTAIHGTMKSVAREMNRRAKKDDRPNTTGFRPVPAKLGRTKGYPRDRRNVDRDPNSRYPYPTGMDTDDMVIGRKRLNENENQSPDSKRKTLRSEKLTQEKNTSNEENEDSVERSSAISENQKMKPHRRKTVARMEQVHQSSGKDLSNSKSARSKSHPVVGQNNRSNNSEPNTAIQSSKPGEEDGRWHHTLRNNQNRSSNDEEKSLPSERILKRQHDSNQQNPQSLSVVDFLRGTLDRPLRKAPPQEVTFRPIYKDSCCMDDFQNSSKDTTSTREWNMHTKSKEPYYRRNGPPRSRHKNEAPYYGSHRPTTARSKRSWRLLPSTESLRSLQRFGYNALSNLCGMAPTYDNRLSSSTSNSSDVSLQPSASRMAVNAATKLVDIAIRLVAIAFILYLVFHEEPFQLGGTSPI